MTVLAEVLDHQYPGNDVADEFDFDFTIFDSSELVARLIEDDTGDAELLVLGTDYTLSVSSIAGGTVTTTDPVPAGFTLDLRPVYEVTQTSDIKNQGTFRADVHERAFDKLGAQQQMLLRLSRRCLHLADYGEDDAVMQIPARSVRAGMFSTWGPTGEPGVSSGTGADAGLRVDLASTTSGSDGSRLIGYRLTEGSSVARSIFERLRERKSVRDFGVTGDGSTNDAPFFTAAIAAAIAGGFALYVPPPNPGAYFKLTEGIVIPRADNFSMIGAGKTISTFKTHGTFSTALLIGDAIGQQIRGHIEGIGIDCRDDTAHGRTTSVQYGIRGNQVEEHDFECVSVYGTTVACWSIGYGYTNNYKFCEASYGDGDGFTTNNVFGQGGNNSLLYLGCLALGNLGIGLKLGSGANATVIGCNIEVNGKTGIWANAYAGLKIIATHFEKNAAGGTPQVAMGFTFTVPSQLVRAQIILVGSGTDTDMSAAFATTNVSVENSRIVPFADDDTCFIFNAGVNKLQVKSCGTTRASVPCVAQMYDNQYCGSGLRIEDCPEFTTPIAFLSPSSGVNNNAAQFIDIDNLDNGQPLRNYAQTDFNQWGILTDVAAADVWRRSQGGAALYRYHQTDVWELVTVATGSSDLFGFAYTAENYPELIGKLMCFTLAVQPTDATRYLRPHCSERAFNANPTPNNVFTDLSVTFVWPASGTVSFGVRKEGAATSGSGYVAAPRLNVVGVPAKKALALIPQFRKEWRGAAAPTAGTWEDGDIVWNSAPAAGGAPGWMCTTPGSSGGTFKAMANLAA